MTLNHCSSLCICKAGPEMWLSRVEGADIPAICKMKLPWASLSSIITFFSSSPYIRLKILAWRCKTASKNMFLESLSTVRRRSGFSFTIRKRNSKFPFLIAQKMAPSTQPFCLCFIFDIDISLHMRSKSLWQWAWIPSISCKCSIPLSVVQTMLSKLDDTMNKNKTK